jgi:hypothetical protein
VDNNNRLIVYGGTGSFVTPLGGGTISYGGYYDTHTGETGSYWSITWGNGIDVSISLNGGVMHGGPSVLDGEFMSYNGSVLFGDGQVIINPRTGQVIGYTGGMAYGPYRYGGHIQGGYGGHWKDPSIEYNDLHTTKP